MFVIRFLKYLVFILFFLLNSSFAADLSCLCCDSDYFKNYEEGKSFETDGLDVYIVDNFVINGIDIFNSYYVSFLDEDDKNPISRKEKYNINAFLRNEDSSNKLNFSSHKNPWHYHIYKKEKNDEENKNLIEALAKKMSTEGGNNFDWETECDKPRSNERNRSKVRHNKNVIIVKLKGTNDPLFKNTIYTFRKFVNMSYRPVPIIFTGNFEYKDFEGNLKNFNEDYTEEHGKYQNGKIKIGEVDKKQSIDNKTCFYIQQKEDFIKKVREKLESAAVFHNSKSGTFSGETFNIAILGQKRSGKTTLTNIFVNNGLCAKAANDHASVTGNNSKFFHMNVDKIPISVIDTAGFENGANYCRDFIRWLEKPYEKNQSIKNADTIHAIIYIINAEKFPKPDEFCKPGKDTDNYKRRNELFEEEEEDVFKKLKELKIPVVFNISRSGSFSNGYKFLRKFFGDLILINELSNYDSEDQEWKNNEQWFSLDKIRSNLIEFGEKETTGKYGLCRLINCIHNLYACNSEYQERLPDFLKEKNMEKFKEMCNSLKKQFRTKGFKDDEKEEPLTKNGKDLIQDIFESGLLSSLEALHINRKNTTRHKELAKKILNYVCNYEYNTEIGKICEEVVEKILKENKLLSFGNKACNAPVLGLFCRKLVETVSGEKGNIEDVIKKMIKDSLPKIKLGDR